jgi:hypothetical protein
VPTLRGGHSEHSWIAVFEQVYATLPYEGSVTPGELARLDLAAVGAVYKLKSS